VVAATTVLGDWQESLITVLQLAILAVCSWLLAIVAFVVQDVTLAPVSDRHGRQPTVAAGPHPGHLAAAAGRQDQLRDHRSGSEAGSGRSPGCWFACHLSQYLAHFDLTIWRSLVELSGVVDRLPPCFRSSRTCKAAERTLPEPRLRQRARSDCAT
jgi:hypothetical protein